MFSGDLLGRRNGGLAHVERRVLEMLDVDRHTLDLATSGLLGSANPEALRSAVSDSDHGVNLLVQQVRHPRHPCDMSIIKDIERVGDYAKQLLCLARVRGPFAPGTAENVELTAYSSRIAGHVTAVRGALAMHDGPAATALIIDVQALTDDLHTAVHQLLVADLGVSDGAAQALSYHYLARIAAHLSRAHRHRFADTAAHPLDYRGCRDFGVARGQRRTSWPSRRLRGWNGKIQSTLVTSAHN